MDMAIESKNREIYGVTIRQDENNSFLCLTDLQEAYTRKRVIEGWSDKRVTNILSYTENAERVYYILKHRDLVNDMSFEEFMKMVKENSLIKTLKHLGAYSTTGARENKVVMCDPYVWVLVALELNPEIFGTVINWLSDTLILNRIEAGSRYNSLSRAASKFPDVDYAHLAQGLNYIVFNKHETTIREKATKEQLKELEEVQGKLSFAIDMGFITSFDQLMNEMRKMYNLKYNQGKYIASGEK